MVSVEEGRWLLGGQSSSYQVGESFWGPVWIRILYSPVMLVWTLIILIISCKLVKEIFARRVYLYITTMHDLVLMKPQAAGASGHVVEGGASRSDP